jgi:hypothetical protein
MDGVFSEWTIVDLIDLGIVAKAVKLRSFCQKPFIF